MVTYSSIVSLTYASVFGCLFFGTSIYSLWDVDKQQIGKERKDKSVDKQQEVKEEKEDKARTQTIMLTINNDQSAGDVDDSAGGVDVVRNADGGSPDGTGDNTDGGHGADDDTDKGRTINIDKPAGKQEQNNEEKKEQNGDADDRTRRVDGVGDDSPGRTGDDADGTADDVDDDSGGCYWFIKEWFKSIWKKKAIYWAIFPHIFDQATDLGVIIEYYQEWNDGELSSSELKILNPMWFFYVSVFIVILQRVVSTATIYAMTRSYKSAFYQFLDVLMVKAVWINYVLKLDKPCNPQRYLELLEAIFESAPQVLLSTGYILKSIGIGNDPPIIVIISTLFSLWSLTSKVVADDKLLFNKGRGKYFGDIGFKYLGFKCKCNCHVDDDDDEKYYGQYVCCCIQFNWGYFLRLFWRLFEIMSRIFMLLLIWINVGGESLFTILSFELCFTLFLSVKNRTPDPMANMMYISICFSQTSIIAFWGYRFVSNYIYLILLTIFSSLSFEAALVPDYSSRNKISIKNALGLFMLIFSWCSLFIWPCLLFVIIAISNFRQTTTRDLMEYAKNGQWNDYRALIRFGLNINIDQKDYIGGTLLHNFAMSASKDEIDLVKDVLDQCPDIKEYINKKNNRGKTPLHYVNTRTVAELLIEKGADIEAVDEYKTTPLLYAADKKRYDVVEYFINIGANLNATDKDKRTPLHHVKTRAVAELLIEKGADIEALDKDKTTPLLYAAYKGRYDVVKYFINIGANLNATDEVGKSIIDYVSEKDLKSIIRFGIRRVIFNDEEQKNLIELIKEKRNVLNKSK